MGSFNEVCALSNLNIESGTPVRLLFLTQNPYIASDQQEARRGCYHYDQWFARTPPIEGVYDDYGRCKFETGPLTDLICEVFQKDVIERPFGFNQYHAGDVTKTKGIHHFLNAASQGRLLVRDGDRAEDPVLDGYPDWRKIHDLFRAKNLPVQLDSDCEEGIEGYNAQPIVDGVVCVSYRSYGNTEKHLKKAQKLLSKEFNCKIVQREFKHKGKIIKNNFQLLVWTKLAEIPPPEIDKVLTHHPENYRKERKFLPVLSVMIREDVFQAYCSVSGEGIKSGSKICDDIKATLDKEYYKFNLPRVVPSIPFQTLLDVHLNHAKESNYPEMDNLIKICGELVRVEHVMATLSHSWQIPSLGHQQGFWDLRTKLLKKITKISEKELKEERKNSECD